MLADLESEMEKVRVQARKRGVREAKAERQVVAVMEAGEKGGQSGSLGGGGGGGGGGGAGGYNTRGTRRKGDDDWEGDIMEVDHPGGSLGGGGKKRSGKLS